MPSFIRPLPYQSTHRKYFSKGLISGRTFYIFLEDIKIRFQEPILKLRFFTYCENVMETLLIQFQGLSEI